MRTRDLHDCLAGETPVTPLRYCDAPYTPHDLRMNTRLVVRAPESATGKAAGAEAST